MMKKLFAVLILTLAAVSFLERPAFCSASLPPIQESNAYKQYLKRPKVELSRLIYLMDRFKSTDFKVVYDGYVYDSDYALKVSKQYISDHYKNEKAENWVQLNSYRSTASHKIIYLKYSDRKLRPLRDALVDELHLLQPLEKV